MRMKRLFFICSFARCAVCLYVSGEDNSLPSEKALRKLMPPLKKACSDRFSYRRRLISNPPAHTRLNREEEGSGMAWEPVTYSTYSFLSALA